MKQLVSADLSALDPTCQMRNSEHILNTFGTWDIDSFTKKPYLLFNYV